MPKPRFGKIPDVRLSNARIVRDVLRQEIGDNGNAFLSINFDVGYSVIVRLYVDSDIDETNINVSSFDVPIYFGNRIKRRLEK